MIRELPTPPEDMQVSLRASRIIKLAISGAAHVLYTEDFRVGEYICAWHYDNAGHRVPCLVQIIDIIPPHVAPYDQRMFCLVIHTDRADLAGHIQPFRASPNTTPGYGKIAVVFNPDADPLKYAKKFNLPMPCV